MDKRLFAFLPIPALTCIIACFRFVLKSPAFYDPGFLISVTNTLFVTVICFAVAYIARRNYRLTGRMQLLLLGCGVLAFGIGGAIAGLVRGLPAGANLNVTVYNTGALVGALFHGIAALMLIAGVSSETGSRPKGGWLAAGYLGVIVFMAAVTLASVRGLIPPFFIQGQGPTPLRQGILGTADALFAFSCLVFLAMYVRNKEIFLYWYALALALTAISLTAFFVEFAVGDPISWAGRTAQYIGGIYFFIAIRSAVGGARERKTTFDNIITASLSPPVAIREVLESITDGFFFLDRTWRFTYVNKKAAGYWGKTPAELLGKNIWQTVPQAAGTIFEEQYQKALAAQSPASFESVSPTTGDWVEVRAYPSKDGLSVYFNDIGERKRAEERLRESEARYRMLHESMRDAFVQVDLEGRIVMFNDLYSQMLGYSPEELRQLAYPEITPECWHELEARIMREQIMARGYSDVYQKEYRRKDGTVFPVELRTVLSLDTVGKPVAMWAIVRDITERKKAEEETRCRIEELRDANEELGRFNAAAVGRELQMIELKKEVNALCGRMGEPHRYNLDFEKGQI